MTLLEWGAVALAVAAVTWWLGWPGHKFTTVSAVIGTCIVSGGLFGSLLTKVALMLSHLTDSLTAKLFGVAVPGMLSILLLIIVIHDVRAKGSASKRTVVIAMVLVALLVAGTSTFSALNGIPNAVRTGVGSTVSSVNGG